MSEEKKLEVDVNSSGGAFMFGCFATFWLTIEEPDIIDAIIHFLMK